VLINREGESSVHGLFAAGDCAGKGPVIGACVGITGVSLAWANYTGAVVGKSAAAHALQAGPAPVDTDAWRIAEQNMLAPLCRSSFVARERLVGLGNLMGRVDVSLVRSAERLSDALERVRQVASELQQEVGAQDPHDLMLWHEAASTAIVAEATLLSAQERRETRGAHYREDFPATAPGLDKPLGLRLASGRLCVEWLSGEAIA
jgi:succinate dehydrogenase/fumarate reductase flavoprotein subunit